MNNSLTNKQISAMMYSIIVGYGVINIPKDVGSAAGTGSWFSLLLGAFIFLIITYIITYLQYTHEGKTLYEYSKILLGKSISNIFLFIYLIYFFIFFSMLVRLYSEVMNLSILIKTPEMFMSAVTFIVIGYALLKGIATIARVCEIYVPLNIIGTIFIAYLMASQGKLVNIRPLFCVNDISTYFSALKTTILPYIGMEILLFIPISKKENKNIFKYTLLTVIVIAIIFIILVEATISVVGIDTVVYLKATVLFVLKGLDIYSIDIIRRLDGFYIIIWTMNLVCAMSLWSYGIVTILNRKLNSIKYTYIVIAVIFAAFLASQIPKNLDQIETIMKYNAYFGIIPFFFIPLILFIVTKVKMSGKKK